MTRRVVSWREALLVAASTLLGLVAFELGLRFAHYEPAAAAGWKASPFVAVSGPQRYAFVRGYFGPYGGATVEINSWGFRGPGPSNDARAARVAVVGDSVAFGVGVPFEATFASELGRSLGRSGVPAQVFDLAIPGYDTLQEVALLEAAWDALKPGLVVLQFSLNDAEAASFIEGKLSENELFGGFLVAHSRVLQLVVRARNRRRLENYHRWVNGPGVFRAEYGGQIDSLAGDAELATLMNAVRARLSPDAWPARWYADAERVGRIRHAFADLQSFTRARGVKVLVLLVPLLDQDGAVYPFSVAHDVVAHEALRCGFSVSDATPALLARGMSRLRARPDDDVHPNAEGHAELARVLLMPVLQHLPERP